MTDLADSPGNTSRDGSVVGLVGFVGFFFQLSGLRFRFLDFSFLTTGSVLFNLKIRGFRHIRWRLCAHGAACAECTFT